MCNKLPSGVEIWSYHADKTKSKASSDSPIHHNKNFISNLESDQIEHEEEDDGASAEGRDDAQHDLDQHSNGSKKRPMTDITNIENGKQLL